MNHATFLADRSHPLALALEDLAQRYGVNFLDSDPVRFPHRYPNRDDREVAAFIAALLAFGNARSIGKSLSRVFSWMGPSPSGFLEGLASGRGPVLRGTVHRWIRGPDLRRFLIGLGRLRQEAGSLEAAFVSGDTGGSDFSHALESFVGRLEALTPRPHTRGVRSFLVSPARGSACKRWNLLLRWLVRPYDGIDLGLWNQLPTARLTIPLDTHVARISTYIGLTQRRTPNWKMAREITEALKQIDAEDPTRFDFALARLGILDHCPRAKSASTCRPCALFDLCQLQ